MESLNNLVVIKCKYETFSKAIEVKRLLPGLTTISSENFTLAVPYQKNCVVTIFDVLVESRVTYSILIDSK
jgi:hypothetical protein